MQDFKTLFSSLSTTNNLRLIDNELPLDFFYGLDSEGRITLALSTSFPTYKIPSTKLLDVVQKKDNDKFWVYICLKDKSASSTFFSFCDDLIDAVKNLKNEKEAYEAFEKRLNCWKTMFSLSNPFLSREEIQGLFGELVFADRVLFGKFGHRETIESWGGPSGTSKDFSIGLDWYEVKTISSEMPTVKISSHQQLISNNPGHLIVVKIENMPDGFDNGVATVNQLFKKIKLELKSDSVISKMFFEKISSLGYRQDEYYDKYRFKLVDIQSYCVDEKFPVLRKTPEMEKFVGKISYELYIGSLTDYKEDLQ